MIGGFPRLNPLGMPQLEKVAKGSHINSEAMISGP